jgi:hypothetical protein
MEPGYSRLFKSTDTESSKKFVAASLCFTDYQTGKSLDFDSLKPKPNSGALLPAQP